jgi:hypothetical protein
MDRGGHLTINSFINPINAKVEFNPRQPANDKANYLQPSSHVLQYCGYPPDEANQDAPLVFPDILRYDHVLTATRRSRRNFTDDIFSARLAWLAHGRVTSDRLKPVIMF